jgi:hypothetical protein
MLILGVRLSGLSLARAYLSVCMCGRVLWGAVARAMESEIAHARPATSISDDSPTRCRLICCLSCQSAADTLCLSCTHMSLTVTDDDVLFAISEGDSPPLGASCAPEEACRESACWVGQQLLLSGKAPTAMQLMCLGSYDIYLHVTLLRLQLSDVGSAGGTAPNSSSTEMQRENLSLACRKHKFYGGEKHVNIADPLVSFD